MGTIAITGERIWDGEGFSAGTILIEDGIVRERGAFVGLPAGIRVINAGSHEVLPGLVDVHRDDDAVILAGDAVQVDDDLLVVPVPGAGEVVPHVAHGLGVVGEVAEVDHVVVVHQLAVFQQDGKGVAVDGLGLGGEEALALLLYLIPAQAHHHVLQAGVVFGQADLLSLFQIDRHCSSSFICSKGASGVSYATSIP